MKARALAYRAEIDGLRALAVAGVVLAHAGVGVPGGYVGVDVFFVISGYLITAIALDGPFDPVRFYVRRAKRILPALAVVCAATAALAPAVLPPRELEAFGRALAATGAFMSNILFMREAGYFAPAAELNPLIHTWSLAVEEQFYLLFPLLPLAVGWLGRRAAVLALAALIAASLALCVWALPRFPSQAFYLLPTRAWELGAGMLLALLLPPAAARAGAAGGDRGRERKGERAPKGKGARRADGEGSRDALKTGARGAGRADRQEGARWARRALLEGGGLAGLVLILVPALFYDARTPFPGLAAVPPVLGAVLVLACADRTTLAGRLLSLRPLVGLGAISYSLYLWHQPVLAFARARLAEMHEPWTTALLLALMVGLATLTFFAVERPARRARWTSARVAGASAAVLAGLVGLGGLAAQGRLLVAPGALAAFAASAAPSPLRAECHAGPERPARAEGPCILLAGAPASGPARIAVFGDSHGVELAHALSEALPDEPIAWHTFSACGPGAAPASPCGRWAEARLSALVADRTVETVVVVYRLLLHLVGDHRAAWPGVPAPRPDAAARAAALRAMLARLEAAGKRVIFVRQAPELPLPAPVLAARQGPSDPVQGAPRAWWEARRAVALDAEPAGLTVVDPADVLCDAARCEVGAGGRAWYFDTDHLSAFGARRVAARLAATLAEGPSGTPAPGRR